MLTIRVIEVPIILLEEGEHPSEVANRCAQIQHYVTRVRMPEALHGLALWLSPKLRFSPEGLRLDLHLSHDGQLPLQFRAPRGRGYAPAFTEELDRLSGCIEAALNASNDIWTTAAEIANADEDPAGEIQYLRWKSGYKAPVRPPKAPPGNALSIVARQRELVLASPDVRPEYLEQEQVLVGADCRVTNGRLHLRVTAIEPVDAPRSNPSRLAAGQPLNARWPSDNIDPWVACAAVASILGHQVRLAGQGIVSMHTLEPKAIQVAAIANASEIVNRFISMMAPVLQAEKEFRLSIGKRDAA